MKVYTGTKIYEFKEITPKYGELVSIEVDHLQKLMDRLDGREAEVRDLKRQNEIFSARLDKVSEYHTHNSLLTEILGIVSTIHNRQLFVDDDKLAELKQLLEMKETFK